MKIRISYVSNSSSSSFIIRLKEEYTPYNKNNLMISDVNTINNLLVFGFKYCLGLFMSVIINGPEKILKKSPTNVKDYQGLGLYYNVLCNQDDIITYLTRRNIPFYASIHNNDFLYVYDGKSNYIDCYTNYVNMYPCTNINDKDYVNKSMNWNMKTYKPYFKLDLHGNYYNDNNYDNTIGMYFIYQNKLNNKLKQHFTLNEINKIKNFIYTNKNDILQYNNQQLNSSVD